MNSQLCLKWNNHNTAILKNLSNILLKPKYCDATIVCQGKHFPVHRIILSTCSEYFEEILERIQCQHPYIVFKDIEPREMELLLNYMYQGEMTVLQDYLPRIIKAAEALRVRGLAVPDGILSTNDGNISQEKINFSKDILPQHDKIDQLPRSEHSLVPKISNLTNDSENCDDFNYELKNSTPAYNGLNHIQAHIIKEEPFDRHELDDATQPVGSINHQQGTSLNESMNNTSLFSIFHQSKEPSSIIEDKINKEQSLRVQEFQESQPRESSPHLPVTCNDRGENGINQPYPIVGYKNRDFRRCTYCSYVGLSSNMRRHIKYKHTRERPFACCLCSARFTEKITLKRHMRIHTGEKPFECSKCHQKFSSKFNLNYHLVRKHGAT